MQQWVSTGTQEELLKDMNEHVSGKKRQMSYVCIRVGKYICMFNLTTILKIGKLTPKWDTKVGNSNGIGNIKYKIYTMKT